MSTSLREDPVGEGLRERPVARASNGQINAENTTDRMDGHAIGHVEKGKKTFGRTPDGTGEPIIPFATTEALPYS
jgi:hypothetical protein